MNGGETLISTNKLTKRFGHLVAVDTISFSVARGEVLGFLGPNGAGKTTTMRMITGFLVPDGGTVAICGHDVADEPIKAQEKLGYLPEGAPLYADMTPQELLRFVASTRKLSADRAAERIRWSSEQLGLGPVLHQPIETLSKGYKRRVGFAQAILHDPDVLVLDEPTDGLDPNQKHEVRTLIRNMAKDKAIIISTHILEEVDAVCTRAMVITQGKVVADCSPGELAARSRHHNAVELSVRGASGDDLRQMLVDIHAVSSVELLGAGDGLTTCMVFPEAGEMIIAEISKRLHGRGWEIDQLRIEHGRLDDVFRDITTSVQ